MKLRLLIRTFVLTGVLFASAIVVLAQEPTAGAAKPGISPAKQRLIAQLLDATQARKNALAIIDSLNSLSAQTSALVWESLEGDEVMKRLSAADREELKKKMLDDSARADKRMQELFAERIDITKVIEDIFYELYDKHFTEAELQDLVSFYQSSTGKKSIAVQPKMFSESMQMVMEKIKPKALEIMAEFSKEEAARLKKELEAKNPITPKPKRTTRPRRRP